MCFQGLPLGLSSSEPQGWLSELQWPGLASMGRQKGDREHRGLVSSMRPEALPVLCFSLSPALNTAPGAFEAGAHYRDTE